MRSRVLLKEGSVLNRGDLLSGMQLPIEAQEAYRAALTRGGMPSDEPDADDDDYDGPIEFYDENRSPPRSLRLSPLQRFPDAFSSQSFFQAFRSELDAVGHDGISVAESPVELLAWVLPIGDDKTEVLLESMSHWLRMRGEKITAEDLLDQVTNEVNTNALIFLVKRLGSKANRRQLRDIYLKLNRDLNASTLFLLAHPTQEDARLRIHYSSIYRLRYYDGDIICRFGPGVLWTGDAPAQVLGELLHDNTHLLARWLEKVLFHQVAHHGSISSLFEPWVEHVGSRWKDEWCPTPVISCGRSNDFGHPSPRVLWEYGGEVVFEGSEAFEGSFEWL